MERTKMIQALTQILERLQDVRPLTSWERSGIEDDLCAVTRGVHIDENPTLQLTNTQRMLLAAGHKIAVIKDVRTKCNVSLYDAKVFVEQEMERLPIGEYSEFLASVTDRDEYKRPRLDALMACWRKLHLSEE